MAKDPGNLGGFTGIDLRRSAATSDPMSLRVGTNVSLTVGKKIASRPRLVKLCDVSSETVGLYSADGLLRTVCPGGQSIQDGRPTEVWYDAIGNGTAYALGTLSKLHAMELAAAGVASKAYPYVCVETTSGRREHHWIDTIPVTSATAVNSLVNLPFDPGKALVKSQNKLFADDPSAGVLRFSATTTTPRDWTKARDAGFLAVRRQSAGSTEIVGLSYFKEYVAVLFQDSIQLWQMNPDPSNIKFVSALNGPGTETPRLTTNVLGDMFYFSRGGFRSLSRSLVTGDNKAEDIGAKVADLTSGIDTTTYEPVSLWAESRSQFLAAFGTTVFVLTYSPSTDSVGWTTWELPVPVEYMTENGSNLYIRSGDTVYVLDEAAEEDTAGPVSFDVALAFQTYGQPRRKKRWETLDVVQDGSSRVNYHLDPKNPDVAEFATGILTTNDTFDRGKIAINRTSDTLGLRFSGTGTWELDSVMIDATVLRGRG